MACDLAAARGWITERIREARWPAEEARAAAYDIEIKLFSTPRSNSRTILRASRRGWPHGCSRLTLSNCRDASPVDDG
jgi:hypothetical protein